MMPRLEVKRNERYRAEASRVLRNGEVRRKFTEEIEMPDAWATEYFAVFNRLVELSWELEIKLRQIERKT